MENIVKQVVNAVGGAGNIIKCENCMTRLRLTLKDDSLADRSSVKSISGVFGLIEAQDQFQVVLGPGKAAKAAAVINAQ